MTETDGESDCCGVLCSAVLGWEDVVGPGVLGPARRLSAECNIMVTGMLS